MTVLTNLLPGLRDLRAPLAAGYLWLLVGWLVATDHEWKGGFGDLAQRAEAAVTWGGKPIAAVAVSFGAYLIGCCSTAASDRMLESVRRMCLRLAFNKVEGLDYQGTLHILQTLPDEFVRSIDRRSELTEEGRRDRAAEALALAETSVTQLRHELDERNTTIGKTVDRLRAEAEFRNAVILPLIVLAAVLIAQVTPWFAVIIVGPVLLGIQVWRRTAEETLLVLSAPGIIGNATAETKPQDPMNYAKPHSTRLNEILRTEEWDRRQRQRVRAAGLPDGPLSEQESDESKARAGADPQRLPN